MSVTLDEGRLTRDARRLERAGILQASRDARRAASPPAERCSGAIALEEVGRLVVTEEHQRMLRFESDRSAVVAGISR